MPTFVSSLHSCGAQYCDGVSAPQVVWQQLVSEDKSRINTCRGVRSWVAAQLVTHSTQVNTAMRCTDPLHEPQRSTVSDNSACMRAFNLSACMLSLPITSTLVKLHRKRAARALHLHVERTVMAACRAEARGLPLLPAVHGQRHHPEARTLVRTSRQRFCGNSELEAAYERHNLVHAIPPLK